MIRSLMLCLGLAGCGAVVSDTLDQLEHMNPMVADPGDFTIWLNLPEGLAVAEDSARSTVEVARGQDQRQGSYVLEDTPTADGSLRFRIAEADQPALRKLQATARLWEAEAPRDTSGSIGIGLEPCLVGAGPAPDAELSVDLALTPGGPRRPLMRPTPVSRFARAMERALERPLGPCPSGAAQ